MVRRITDWFWALMTLIGRNWLTLLGATLTTVSALLIVAFLIVGFLGIGNSPYMGIMAFLVLPGVFIAGLLLIPAGVYWGRKAARRRELEGAEPSVYPKIDFSKPRVRHLAAIVTALTVINLLIISLVSYEGVVYMETVQFCGQVCHSVMDPEYTAYIRSPHARVACVACHIGSGAPWFVRSKLSGVSQVIAVTFNTYERPIPVPVANLRPSRETCEECHWPRKFVGERVRIIEKFSADEANSPLRTVLLMHIGGGENSRGIHGWHMDPKRRISYVAADRQRQRIPWVQVQDVNGKVTEYKVEGAPPANAERRQMDCIDCHNRPTHIFLLPEQGMDGALADGRIDKTIPFIKKVGVETLREAGPKPDGLQIIEPRLRAYYQKEQAAYYAANRGKVDSAIREIQNIYSTNVFPKMKLTWGSYPVNIGHELYPGCFRCHDSEHTSVDGKTIEQDCDKCHSLLAQDEKEPEILKQLGIQ